MDLRVGKESFSMESRQNGHLIFEKDEMTARMGLEPMKKRLTGLCKAIDIKSRSLLLGQM
jgi:hypothetical protein